MRRYATASAAGTRRRCASRASPPSASPRSRSAICRPSTSRCASRSRSACAPSPSSRTGAASRLRAASPPWRRPRSTRRSSRRASGSRASSRWSAPRGQGDFLVIDYSGSIDGEPIERAQARAQLLELGSGGLLPGFEEGLLGVRAGEQRTLDAALPRRLRQRRSSPAATRASRSASRRCARRSCPSSTTTSRVDAAGFDTLEELREDLRARLLEVDERAVEREFREAVIDAAAAAATVTVPEALVEARAKEAWEQRLHSLSHQRHQQGRLPADRRLRPRRRCSPRRGRAPSGRCARRR